MSLEGVFFFWGGGGEFRRSTGSVWEQFRVQFRGSGFGRSLDEFGVRSGRVQGVWKKFGVQIWGSGSGFRFLISGNATLEFSEIRNLEIAAIVS